MQQPETYYLIGTEYVPNSSLATLVYRQCFSGDLTKEAVRETIERNHWITGGVWKHYPTHHFHPNTHECYAVFKGSSTILIGRGPLDGKDYGKEVKLSAGDIIVLPAGTCHCNTESTTDYEYWAMYPEGSPRWINRWAKDKNEKTANAEVARSVPIPKWDPVFGKNGPLCDIWSLPN